MKTKDEILNMFPETQEFSMSMNSIKVENFIVSDSRESADKFMARLNEIFSLNQMALRYYKSPEEMNLMLKDGTVYFWRLIDQNIRGHRFSSLIIDLDNIELQKISEFLVFYARCGKDKIKFFDDFI